MRKINYGFILSNILAVAAIWLFVENQFYKSIAVYILINAVNATGFNILLGYTGIISLGQAAFFGIGAYVSGVLSVQFGFDPILTIFFGAFISFVVAVVVGYPSLKLHGNYLAMATLGFGMIIYIVMNEMSDLTGGPSGLVGIPSIKFFGSLIDSEDKFFAFMGIFFCLSVVLFELFDKSFVSFKLKFIKESEFASKSFGINVFKTKVIVFAVVAAITAINGSLFAFYSHFISPVSFGFKYSVELLTMAIVGGLGSISGGILGSSILTVLPELISGFEDYEMIIYGGFLAFVIMFFPNGVAGIIEKISNSIKKVYFRYVKS